MRHRNFRPWYSALTVFLVLLGFNSGLCYAQVATIDKQAAKADAKKPSIYDQNADAKAQVASATARAERANKRVLLMFGGDWCGWCHKLHDLFAKNTEIRRLLSYEYELVMVDTKAPHAQELLEEMFEGPDRRRLPVPGRDGCLRQAAGRAEDRPARRGRPS